MVVALFLYGWPMVGFFFLPYSPSIRNPLPLAFFFFFYFIPVLRPTPLPPLNFGVAPGLATDQSLSFPPSLPFFSNLTCPLLSQVLNKIMFPFPEDGPHFFPPGQELMDSVPPPPLFQFPFPRRRASPNYS